ncbi:hypothetical protein [uncultured Eubacterium sp.]|uniref:hypothetical protein n=1 Tax=uncultured Eubacterium sp. TaxID=165185 RepID=UPI002591CB0A|nr:hypothetical protein [uncultured Eubacterium sp.]
MEIGFARDGKLLQIDDARIIFKNFSGEESKFNRAGDRNFAVRINDPDAVDQLTADGWNVTVKPPKEEGDDPYMYIKVKIKFNDRGPKVFLKSGKHVRRLSEQNVGLLDSIDILRVDLDLRAYDWEVNGKTGRTAYLDSINVEQDLNRFEEYYENEFEECED